MTTCNCRGGRDCCMFRQPHGVTRPLPPDQIKPLSPSVGIYEFEGAARKAPPPPPPAPEGWAVPEIRAPGLGLLAAVRRFLHAMRTGGVR